MKRPRLNPLALLSGIGLGVVIAIGLSEEYERGLNDGRKLPDADNERAAAYEQGLGEGMEAATAYHERAQGEAADDPDPELVDE